MFPKYVKIYLNSFKPYFIRVGRAFYNLLRIKENASVGLSGHVHTNADSFESAYFLVSLGLPSTLTRGSDPPNPYKFGNALES